VPSEWYDNSPLVIYESFSMGKPVIASTLGGMPELVDDGDNGYHFPSGDVAVLQEKIRHLWEDDALRHAMGRSARAKAEAEFSPDAHYEKIIAIYEKLLQRQQVLAA